MRRLLQRLRRKRFQDDNTIVVVSGLPRSGTSMMMQMLSDGGLKPFSDSIRRPDPDNPKGYFEYERVKQLATDQSWLPAAKGRVVKIISALLRHLPSDYAYKIVFMQRNMREILASQAKMLARRQKNSDDVSDDEMAQKFNAHLKQVREWIAEQPNIEVLYVHYNRLLQNPLHHCRRINVFFNDRLNIEKMMAVIDPDLYRRRFG